MMLRRGYWQLLVMAAMPFYLLCQSLGATDLSNYLFAVIMLLSGLSILSLAARDCVRYYKAVRFGRLAEAEVLSVVVDSNGFPLAQSRSNQADTNRNAGIWRIYLQDAISESDLILFALGPQSLFLVHIYAYW